ncbi:hypothetical protein MTYM_01206 [Methylococcales bacterium]|nr:hypothetical protein MTYM_01206 [Methylococcales bacterium]
MGRMIFIDIFTGTCSIAALHYEYIVVTTKNRFRSYFDKFSTYSDNTVRSGLVEARSFSRVPEYSYTSIAYRRLTFQMFLVRPNVH